MPIKLEYKTKRSGTLELKLRAFVLEGIEERAPSPFQAEFIINNAIPTLSTGNATQAEWFWEAFLSEDAKTVEVWHKDFEGKKDRLMAVITNT